jgi:hypothetical protein
MQSRTRTPSPHGPFLAAMCLRCVAQEDAAHHTRLSNCPLAGLVACHLFGSHACMILCLSDCHHAGFAVCLVPDLRTCRLAVLHASKHARPAAQGSFLCRVPLVCRRRPRTAPSPVVLPNVFHARPVRSSRTRRAGTEGHRHPPLGQIILLGLGSDPYSSTGI